MIVEKIFEKCLEKGLTIAFAESMTGGLASYKLVELSGASKVLKGSVIVYTNEAKNSLLGISFDDINKYHVVSKEIAVLLAQKVSIKLNSSIGVGITGDAGPTLQEDASCRYVYVAVTNGDNILVEHLKFNEETRKEAQELAVKLAYELLLKVI